MTACWLVKQEPSVYPFSRFLEEGHATWDGVRNAQARNNLRAMKKGDQVLFYHSGEGKEIVGLAKVTRGSYPDPSATEGDWVAVDLAPVKALRLPVTLATIKADATLSAMALVKQSRLSVMPVSDTQFARILQLSL